MIKENITKEGYTDSILKIKMSQEKNYIYGAGGVGPECSQ